MTQDQSDIPQFRYDAKLAADIESKWQQYWDDNSTFRADNPTGDLSGPLADKQPFYVLDMFPYPSGKGLHVGHPLGYIATDVIARFERMNDKNVLYTLGYDAFGLPAEQYAIQTGQHPRKTTTDNIATMSAQLQRLGLSHDKRRVFATTDDDYVKWTQWIFLQIFNSWYDPDAINPSGTRGCARPISELIDEFKNATRPVPHGATWSELSRTEQANIIDSYRLAYVSYAPVNWCPGLGTVLSNEEVTADGKSERGNFPVYKSQLRQWMMRITDYSQRLLDDLDTIDWPEKVRSMQRHWIGQSHGATVRFTPLMPDDTKVDQTNSSHNGASSQVSASQPGTSTADVATLDVFTTRADTLFGATFMVISPEHPLVGELNADKQDLRVPCTWPDGTRNEWTGGYESPREAVSAYRTAARAKTDAERIEEDREKTGIFTGIYALNPVSGKQIPVFMADYVLMDYGTGAIMAVPAHDERDFAFAKKFAIDIITTITPPDDFDSESQAWTGDGVSVNSANDTLNLNGMSKDDAIEAMIDWLVENKLGEATVTYRLRDWLFSRQRYWGEPFPVVYDKEGVVHALPESMLPITLPEIDDFTPRTFDAEDANTSPEPPLGRAHDWQNITLDIGEGKQEYSFDTNTMPNWAGSCWYEIRYCDPTNKNSFIDTRNERYWMGPKDGQSTGGTDLYVGGVEHAVLHLLYARFWQKVLFDRGYVSAAEPFHQLFNQGYIQAYAYTDSRGQYVPADEVTGDESSGFTYEGEKVTREYGKMGKSLKNIVTPDEMCETYGADTFRLYEMSMGPLDLSRPWETRAVVGSMRFLQRLWRNVVDENTGKVTILETEAALETKKLVARTIRDVHEEYSHMRINTAIARMIVLNNHLVSLQGVPREAIEPLLLMVSPVAPHLAEELWNKIGHKTSLAREAFPQVSDESLLEEDAVTCVVQINGKVRERLEVSPSISAEDAEKAALETPAVIKALDGKQPLKVIVRQPKLVNVVVKKK